MELTLETRQFIQAIRQYCLSNEMNDGVASTVSQSGKVGGQVGALAGELGKLLENKINRRDVLSAIVGYPLASQKFLSRNAHHILLDMLITEGDKYGPCICEIENALEGGPIREPWNLLPSTMDDASNRERIGEDGDVEIESSEEDAFLSDMPLPDSGC